MFCGLGLCSVPGRRPQSKACVCMCVLVCKFMCVGKWPCELASGSNYFFGGSGLSIHVGICMVPPLGLHGACFCPFGVVG